MRDIYESVCREYHDGSSMARPADLSLDLFQSFTYSVVAVHVTALVWLDAKLERFTGHVCVSFM